MNNLGTDFGYILLDLFGCSVLSTDTLPILMSEGSEFWSGGKKCEVIGYISPKDAENYINEPDEDINVWVLCEEIEWNENELKSIKRVLVLEKLLDESGKK
jgi:hypothetical protein